MAPPPRVRSIPKTALAGGLDSLLLLLNEALGQVSFALSRRLTRTENLYSGEKLGVAFTTPAADSPKVPVAWDVVDRPKHVFVDGMARADGAALSFAWSSSWKLTPAGNIELSFQGLDTSTSYVCNVTWE